jgi:uncharacterized protein
VQSIETVDTDRVTPSCSSRTWKRCFLGVFLPLLGCLAAAPVILQDLLVCPMALAGRMMALPRMPAGDAPLSRHVVRSSDGTDVTIFAWEVPTATGTPVLLLHGNGVVAEWLVAHQRRFAAAGRSSYVVEYRGFGESPGWPTEAGLYEDATTALRFVAERHSIEPSSVVLFGESLGTGIASRLASRNDSKYLLLAAPYTSIPDAAQSLGLGVYTPFLRWKIPQREYVRRLRRTHVIAVHGDRDTTIPAAHTTRLAAAYTGRGHFRSKVVAGGNHGVALQQISWMLETMEELEAAANGVPTEHPF